jgi:hypothetical protein
LTTEVIGVRVKRLRVLALVVVGTAALCPSAIAVTGGFCEVAPGDAGSAASAASPPEGFSGLPAPPVTAAAPAIAAAAPGSFVLQGHTPLLNRGMNAGLAIHETDVAGVRKTYAYVGSRTDGSHANAGVLVVDVTTPSSPTVVSQIGRPNEGNPGETSRELRVWPEQNLLIVLNFACSSTQRCTSASVAASVRFYDIAGANAAAPKLVSTYRPSSTPHEFFLWDDPARAGRAILYLSLFRNSPSMLVTDISGARSGTFTEWRRLSLSVPSSTSGSAALHSLSVSVDGRRAYLADYGGGFMVADTSQVAAAVANPAVTLITPVDKRLRPLRSPGTHSALKLPGANVALVTEETYSPCPWGWAYTVNLTSETAPVLLATYQTLPYNDLGFCGTAPSPAATKTAHNPTLTRKVALISWHSRGLQAVSLEYPGHPQQLAEFVPTPEASVATEDELTPGSTPTENVAMWSTPIISRGLIYVVDVRNGLYVLRYSGPLQEEIAGRAFLEGNSNLGDAAALQSA